MNRRKFLEWIPKAMLGGVGVVLGVKAVQAAPRTISEIWYYYPLATWKPFSIKYTWKEYPCDPVSDIEDLKETMPDTTTIILTVADVKNSPFMKFVDGMKTDVDASPLCFESKEAAHRYADHIIKYFNQNLLEMRADPFWPSELEDPHLWGTNVTLEIKRNSVKIIGD